MRALSKDASATNTGRRAASYGTAQRAPSAASASAISRRAALGRSAGSADCCENPLSVAAASCMTRAKNDSSASRAPNNPVSSTSTRQARQVARGHPSGASRGRASTTVSWRCACTSNTLSNSGGRSASSRRSLPKRGRRTSARSLPTTSGMLSTVRRRSASSPSAGTCNSCDTTMVSQRAPEGGAGVKARSKSDCVGGEAQPAAARSRSSSTARTAR